MTTFDKRLLSEKAIKELSDAADREEAGAKSRYGRMVALCHAMRNARTEGDAKKLIRLLESK